MEKREISKIRTTTIKKSWKNIIIFILLMSLMTNNYLVIATSAAKLPLSLLEEDNKLSGNVGCLFGKTLCNPELEWCYDDYAFGRCLPRNDILNENDLYRYDLSKGGMQTLEKQMQRLFSMGYRWGHLYTQCVLQNLLESIRHGTEVDESICLSVQDQDLEGALKAFENDINPWDLAFIKFKPSAKNPNSDFADENYRPPKEFGYPSNGDLVEGKELLTKEGSPNTRFRDKLRDPVADQDEPSFLLVKELENKVAKVKGKSKSSKTKLGKGKGKGKVKSDPVKKSLLNVEYPGQSDNFNGVDIGSSIKKVGGGGGGGGQWDETEKLLESLMDESGVDADGFVDENLLRPKIFSQHYNTPDAFRHQVDESWTDLDESLLGESGRGYLSVGTGYDTAPGYNDYLANQKARQEEEDQELEKVFAALQAEALLQSLLKNDESPENELRSEDGGMGLGSPSMDEMSMGEGDRETPFASRDLNDGDLLYTEGGLVVPNRPELSHFRERALEEAALGDEGLNLYKRYPNDFPSQLEKEDYWGPVQDAGDQAEAEEDLITPRDAGFEEYMDTYGFENGPPFYLLDRRSPSGWGFERRERLDVKKPGPWYRTVNSYAFDKLDNEEGKYQRHGDPNPEFGAGEGPADMAAATVEDGTGTPTHPQSDKWQEEQQMVKKTAPVKFSSVLPASMPVEDRDYDIIDTSYANLFLDKHVNWNTAKDLVDSLAYALDLDRTTFKEIKTENDVVTFKVEPNDKGWNASEVARRIPKVVGNIEGDMGLRVLRADAGVRANSKTPSVMALYDDRDQDPMSNQIYVATFAICGLVAAVLVGAVAIFMIRKHSKSRDKLAGLSHDDSNFEACKEYQDLCRARMAGSKNEKTEPIRGPVHKISKESENGTNSSRSSTSSWSEEPAFTSMDISTGHMVLSYMEDHLKNKDRLDKEWAALCAYEADPCSTGVAEKSENSRKNRYSNSLPFDHSRVILNDLANVNGSDYINASTITDHDPRNPAYIATQGPLPNTSADFWQMVWEQGSVVIVNLTKLTETKALCHRYWPEEGSELHHIYEVHLVSEHIWCDEYLVRSFYLKNLKTTETRTVTQFHFMAWPENGVPPTKSLLEFRRKVNKSYRGRSCPIIVHCSDGAGRTGTYCLIDMVLNRMTKGAKEIDIAASLEHIRDQRPGMVRTKQQFEFVLMAVAEEVHAILKALPQ